MSDKIIPVFYACDGAFVKYTIVSMHSMIQNASKDAHYRIHILYTDIEEDMKAVALSMANEQFEIVFNDVTAYLNSISKKLPIRDYYSKTTYYRFFIAEMFPEYEKAIYIDSDTVFQGDVSALYNHELGDNYVGACHEQAMVQVDEYGTYAETVVGVNRHNFFNAGMMLINCHLFREKKVLEQFLNYLHVYDFVVTQDEDYLNVICKDHVLWLDQRWNTEIFGQILYPIEEANVLHYIMTSKPWHYDDCRHADIFWSYAEKTPVFDAIKAELNAYTDEQRANDTLVLENLLKLAVKETNKEETFVTIQNKKKAADRLEILKKIEEYEIAGRFDEDVEEDPPSKELKPEDVDYYREGIVAKTKAQAAYAAARTFVYKLIDDKKLIVKDIKGIEHFKNLNSGAIITCNHFNAFDSFAIQMAYEAADQKERTFYRIIREGNYTSFPGFYGMLMRNCYTLPLSSNHKTLRKFNEATTTLLQRGNFVLVYPEQSMWWNYRKPKPLKPGGYMFAVKADVPVLPCFITMKDSDIVGEDGFFVQEYTIHVGAPIYPDKTLPPRQQVPDLMEKNFAVWKEIYEREYDMPLVYKTKKD
ncbi:MAG: 1-acyl-sn-glycerol-3-phosphate acyltransferase [Clostridia bacterium]|nr:1-acyl-sn-glycerol-3-phosphate acyltransferase [Clostridia bacterium]